MKKGQKIFIYVLAVLLVIELILVFSIPNIRNDINANVIKPLAKSLGIKEKVLCVPSEEICDGVDNDCDGEIDEGGVCEIEQRDFYLTGFPEQEELTISEINEKIKEKGALWIAKENPISRLSKEEKLKRLGLKITEEDLEKLRNAKATYSREEGFETLPDFFDWRDYHANNYITDIRDQSSCGSCWAFGAVAILEGHTNAYYNNPGLDLNLSEQDLVSCYLGDGCDGASSDEIEYIFSNYFQNIGIATEICFPYTAGDEVNPPITPCTNKCPNWQEDAWKTFGYESVNLTIEDIKQALINYGPVEVGMTVYSDFFDYSGGIYSHTTESIAGYHAVTIVGFGTYDGLDYWIVKNSWGEDWGENGYFRIVMGDSGIDSWFAYAVTEPNPPSEQNKICVDSDGDGYCYWGLGDKPVSGCPSCDDLIYDCDDSNSSIFEGCGMTTETLGTLDVNSIPSKVKIFVKELEGDGWIYRGETPAFFDLNEGMRIIKLEKEYYEDYTTSVEIIENQISYLNAILVYKPRIIYPTIKDFAALGEIVNIIGTVPPENFNYYTIEWGAGDDPNEWFTTGITLENGGTFPVIEDKIASWDTSIIEEEGYYTIKLTVYRTSDTFETNVTFFVLQITGLQEGWPQTVNDKILPAIVVGDLDNSGTKEIIAYSKDGYLHAWHYNGSLVEGWPVFTGELSEGDAALLHLTSSEPTLGDLDGDGLEDIVVGGLDGYVYAFDGLGNPLPDWPVYISSGSICSSPSIGDIDNDGDLDVAILGYNSVNIIDGQGNFFEGFPIYKTGAGGRDFCSSPALGDLDGDGDLEIVFGTGSEEKIEAIHHNGSDVEGWPVELEGYIYSSPAIGDVDQDGSLEIAIITRDSKVYLLDSSGNVEDGWPKTHQYWLIDADPALTDFENDGYLEIAFGGLSAGGYFLDIIDKNGNSLNNWPQIIPRNVGGAFGKGIIGPVIGDMNGDIIAGVTEYPDFDLAGDGLARVYIWDINGNVLEGWPNYVPPVKSSPVLSDIDNDGDIELILASMNRVLVFDISYKYNPYTMHWPQFHHDAQHTGCYNCEQVPLACGDVNGDGLEFTVSDVILLGNIIEGSEPIPEWWRNGDMNGDGQLTQVDYTIMLNYLQWQTDIEPTCQPNMYCYTTPHGQCSGYNYCFNGQFVDWRCDVCGCPSGQICEKVGARYECTGAEEIPVMR